jgi:hypothetical protein
MVALALEQAEMAVVETVLEAQAEALDKLAFVNSQLFLQQTILM